MHQAQHSIPSEAQYPDDQHTTSTNSTVLRHSREAGIGIKHQSPTQPDPETAKCQEESILRKSTSSAAVSSRAQSQPQRARLHFHTHRRSRSSALGADPPGMISPPFPAPTTHQEASSHSPHQRIPSLQPQTCLFHWTAEESLLSYSVFHTTG